MQSSSSENRKPEATILLVGDNRHGSSARRTILQEHGFRTIVASNGEEAFHTFSAEAIDLVVTGYKMPKMNGAELIRRIRETKPSTPVILLSGFVDTFGLNERNTGADLVLAKGAHEVDHLLRGVKRFLNPRAKRKPPRAAGRLKARHASTS